MNFDKIRNAVISFTFLLYTDGSLFQYIQFDKKQPLYHNRGGSTTQNLYPGGLYELWDLLRISQKHHYSVCFSRVYHEYKLLPRTSNSSCVHAQPSSYPRPSLAINVRGCSLPQEFQFWLLGIDFSLICTISVPQLSERPSWPWIRPTLASVRFYFWYMGLRQVLFWVYGPPSGITLVNSPTQSRPRFGFITSSNLVFL